MPFINYNDTIGQVVQFATIHITGSEFMTYFLLILVLFVMLTVFKVPVEYSMIMLLPLVIYIWAYSAQFTALAGLILIFLAVLFVKKFFLN